MRTDVCAVEKRAAPGNGAEILTQQDASCLPARMSAVGDTLLLSVLNTVFCQERPELVSTVDMQLAKAPKNLMWKLVLNQA